MQEPMSGCWLWIGSTDAQYGYGRTPIRTEHVGRCAYRYVYYALKGPFPLELHLDHLCRTPCCVNPDHLEPVTRQENTRRGTRNQYTQKTHCPQGHPYDGFNLILYKRKNGRSGRHCRICRNTSLDKWKMRNGLIPKDGSDLEPRKRSYSCRSPNPIDRVSFDNIRVTDAVAPTSIPVGIRTCRICRKDFEYTHPRLTCCSEECSKEHVLRYAREHNKKRRIAINEPEQHAFS
jgi:hypothetical protein